MGRIVGNDEAELTDGFYTSGSEQEGAPDRDPRVDQGAPGDGQELSQFDLIMQA